MKINEKQIIVFLLFTHQKWINHILCIFSNDDLGMGKMHRVFFKEKNLAYPYLESPLNNNIVSPLSDYVHVPDEYMHGLAARNALPKLELNRLATDLVSLFELFSNLNIKAFKWGRLICSIDIVCLNAGQGVWLGLTELY